MRRVRHTTQKYTHELRWFCFNLSVKLSFFFSYPAFDFHNRQLKRMYSICGPLSRNTFLKIVRLLNGYLADVCAKHVKQNFNKRTISLINETVRPSAKTFISSHCINEYNSFCWELSMKIHRKRIWSLQKLLIFQPADIKLFW